MSDDDVDLYVSEVEGGSNTGAAVSTTRIKAREVNDEHVGRLLGFHHAQTQRNVPGRILRVVGIPHVELAYLSEHPHLRVVALGTGPAQGRVSCRGRACS